MPVLSELMAVVEPSVSTERRRLTIAPAAASRVVPIDRIAVTTAGRPVGIAETAKATAVRKRTSNGVFRARPMRNEISSATPAMTRIWFVSALSWRVRGVTSSSVAWSIPLMWPTSVDMPVPVTSSVPAPRVTWVFMNARSTRSPSAASPATSSICFGTGRLSPVRADSSISRVAALRIRPSAGTRSPASMLTMSPGTSCSIGTSARAPSRRTLALTTIIFWSAATLADALPSWFRPIAALSSVRAIRTMPVGIWSGRNRLTTPATSRTICIGSPYWRTKARQRGSFGASANLLSPNSPWRLSTSAAARPRSASTPWRSRATLVGRACQLTDWPADCAPPVVLGVLGRFRGTFAAVMTPPRLRSTR